MGDLWQDLRYAPHTPGFPANEPINSLLLSHRLWRTQFSVRKGPLLACELTNPVRHHNSPTHSSDNRNAC